MTDNVQEIRPGATGEKPRKGNGASKERMAELTRIRLEKAKTNPRALGGRRRRLTDDEIREAVLQDAKEQLLPARAAAIQKLIAHLDHPDAGVQQRAAFKILEYTDGKPQQSIVTEQKGPTVIEYRTAALNVIAAPVGFVPMPLDETA